MATPADIREQGARSSRVAGLPSAGAPIRQSNLWKDAWRRYIRNKAAVVAGAFFVLILLYCLIVPIISPYDPNEVNFAHRQSAAEPRAPVRHRQVRPRPVHAHSDRRPRLDPDRLRGDAGDPLDRRRLRLDLGLRRRPPRQRHDALPRRALRAPLPAVRDHHARDHRHDEHLDDGDRAVDRKLVHDRSDRPRPGDHAEGERLRARGEGGGRAVVPSPRPPPAPEHARRPDHRDLPRAAGA